MASQSSKKKGEINTIQDLAGLVQHQFSEISREFAEVHRTIDELREESISYFKALINRMDNSDSISSLQYKTTEDSIKDHALTLRDHEKRITKTERKLKRPITS